MKVGFDGGIKLEFQGAKVISNGGLLAYRDLDYVLGLFDSVSAGLIDKRTCFTRKQNTGNFAVSS